MNNSSLGTLGLTEPALPTPAWEAQERHAAWCHLGRPQHHLRSLPPSTGCEGGLGKVKTSAAQAGPSVFVLPQGPTQNSWLLFPQAPFPSLGTPFAFLPTSSPDPAPVGPHGGQLLLCGLTVQSHGLSSHLVTAIPTVCLFSRSGRH